MLRRVSPSHPSSSSSRTIATATFASPVLVAGHSSSSSSSSSHQHNEQLLPSGVKPVLNPFARASSWSLIRALIVFQACKIPNVEVLAPTWLKRAEKVFGPELAYNTFAKWCFFDHFCGGRDLDELHVASQQLSRQNIGTILDYAAEAELVIEGSENTSNSNNTTSSSATASSSSSSPNQQQGSSTSASSSSLDQQTLSVTSTHHMGVMDETEEDRLAKQFAIESAKIVEKELPQAAEMFKKAVVHNPTPLDVVDKVYRKKRSASPKSKKSSSSSPTGPKQIADPKFGNLPVLGRRIELEPRPSSFAASPNQCNNTSKLVPQHSEAVYYASEDQLYFPKPMVEMIMNVDRFLTCINNASELRSYRLPVAYAALKATALCDTLLLSRLNSVLLGIRADWLWFSHPTLANITPLQQCRLLLVGQDEQQEEISIIPVKEFREALQKRETVYNKTANDLTEDHINLLIEELDPSNSGYIDYLTYTQYAAEALCGFAGSAISDPQYIAKKKKRMHELGHSESENEKHQQVVYNIFNHIHRGLYQQELDQLQLFYKRFDDVMKQCLRKNVRVMVDAEHSYYQTAIDHVVRELQRKYNKTEPVVSNTYQAYTEIAHARVINDVRRAEREGWVFAAKIVRGAYIEEENHLAKLYGYRSPIWETKKLTDMCYNSIADRLLRLCRENPQVKYGILFGTHNAHSTYYISEKVAVLPVECKCEISFAQLYGMSDDLTFFLTRQGFNVFKYLPYGPVKETLAYLMRRAQENRSMLKQENPSVPMMRQELKKRAKYAFIKLSAAALVLWMFYAKFFSKYTLVLKSIDDVCNNENVSAVAVAVVDEGKSQNKK